jgi:Uma2 family endonuclease
MIQRLKSIPPHDSPFPLHETLPTMYDLPSEDPEEPGLPDEFHDLQPQLLSATLRLTTYTKDQYFTGTDLNLYYDLNHLRWYKRPDWFLSVGVPRRYDRHGLRLSYVMWQEKVSPLVVVELLSPGTEKEDLGIHADSLPPIPPQSQISPPPLEADPSKEAPPSKWQVYEQILQIPYYIVFSRYDNRLYFFHLIEGRYQRQLLDSENPRIWIPELELGLGLWEGEFDDIDRFWLRWYDAEENWVPTNAEFQQQRAEYERQQAEYERQQAEYERQQSEQERQRANAAEEQLRQVVMNLLQANMPVAQVASITGLTEEQIERMHK